MSILFQPMIAFKKPQDGNPKKIKGGTYVGGTISPISMKIWQVVEFLTLMNEFIFIFNLEHPKGP